MTTTTNTTAKGKPLVTVITIFLNAERFLNEAMASVFAQSFDHWEYLLVDDGSSDGSSQIVHDWARRYPGRVRYLTHAALANRGMAASRNRGLQEAHGEYVAFLDADDVWLPDKLEQQVAVMQAHDQVGMVYGKAEIWFSWAKNDAMPQDYFLSLGLPEDTVIESPRLLLMLLENKAQSPMPSSMLLRRSVVSEVGGFEERFRGIFEDHAFVSKLSLKYPVFVSGQTWLQYRQHPQSCCAVAEVDGSALTTRIAFLRWLESFFREQAVADPQLTQALERELRLCELGTLTRAKPPTIRKANKLKSLARRALKKVRRITRLRGSLSS